MEDPQPTDAELLARIAAREVDGASRRAAFERLYLRHAPAVRGFLGRLEGATDDRTEDWMHDTFLTAARHADTFRVGTARPWLLSIAARRVRDHRRTERRRRDREQDVATRAAEAGESASEDSIDVEAALVRLPENLRATLELRFVQGLPHSRVAEVLGVSLRTAKAWAAEGIERLRASGGEGLQ